jgi:hypothetical protein
VALAHDPRLGHEDTLVRVRFAMPPIFACVVDGHVGAELGDEFGGDDLEVGIAHACRAFVSTCLHVELSRRLDSSKLAWQPLV